MEQHRFETSHGNIAYWTSRAAGEDAPWLVMLPGLTADHDLFRFQTQRFESTANILAWDAPNHGSSRPWTGGQDLEMKARLLHEILEREHVTRPILVGQSMGGYLAQTLIHLFPNTARGFVSVDSCPLKRGYYANWELWCLERTYWMFMAIPWGMLVNWAGAGCSTTQLGRRYMADLMRSYPKKDYCRLAYDGYKALAQAVKRNWAYEIDCPLIAVVGTRDGAGSAKRFNREWEKREHIDLRWIEGAGHNSNMDDPEAVNAVIQEMIDKTR